MEVYTYYILFCASNKTIKISNNINEKGFRFLWFLFQTGKSPFVFFGKSMDESFFLHKLRQTNYQSATGYSYKLTL